MAPLIVPSTISLRVYDGKPTEVCIDIEFIDAHWTTTSF
jgi:hypothetical protein